ncbi:MAG TPA: glycosyltransferase [Ornithinibacter sp.]|nr:glycosyltransferase [Ornithinibacter sp.]
MPPTLTVLMTTYHGTSVEELERSIASLVGQTRPADELLVVVDGPVPEPLDTALATAVAEHPGIRVERLPRNLGSGLASARGLELATGDFLARHDADDVSLPPRFEREMAAIEEHGLDLVGSAMLEFERSPDHVVGVRTNPRTHEQIVARMRLNNPINNPTVVFRRRLAVEVGGYADLRYMQDYDLFARLLAAGARAENLDEPLVLFNAGEGMISRRGGWRMLRHEWDVQRRLMATGTIGPVLLVRNMLVRGAFRIIPPSLLRRVYAVLFRSRGTAPEAAGSVARDGSA